MLDNQQALILDGTAEGKSITYQLTAMLGDDGLTVVFVPTVSLLQDQMQKALVLQLPVCAANGGFGGMKKEQIIHHLLNATKEKKF